MSSSSFDLVILGMSYVGMDMGHCWNDQGVVDDIQHGEIFRRAFIN